MNNVEESTVILMHDPNPVRFGPEQRDRDPKTDQEYKTNQNDTQRKIKIDLPLDDALVIHVVIDDRTLVDSLEPVPPS
jgi:hypothetical protein